MHGTGRALKVMKTDKCLCGRTDQSGLLREQENKGGNAISIPTTLTGKICQREYLFCIH